MEAKRVSGESKRGASPSFMCKFPLPWGRGIQGDGVMLWQMAGGNGKLDKWLPSLDEPAGLSYIGSQHGGWGGLKLGRLRLIDVAG